MNIASSAVLHRLHALALAAAIPAAALAAEPLVADWEKPGDTEGWALPDAAYRKEYGLVLERRQAADKAASGKGALALSLDTAAGIRKGRIDKYYGGKADWKRFERLALVCHVPAGAPPIQGQIAVMSGAWKWSQGAVVDCKAGEWTRVSIDTAAIAAPEEIQLLMFVAYCPAGDFKGEVLLDKVSLEGEIAIEPSRPGAVPESDPGSWLETFDSVVGWERKGARVEPAPQAAVGAGAATFFLPGFVSKKIAAPKPRDPDARDEGWKGISFWAKGDGSDQFGTLVLCGMHPEWFPFKYAYSFPLKDTNWKRYVVGWNDLIPEDPTDLVGTPGGAPPSNVEHVKVGSKWSIGHNSRNLPKFSFSLDHLQLEAEVPAAKPAPPLAPFDAVKARLAAKQPVSILCLGDSISAGTSLGNADQERYAQVLERLLLQRLGYEGVAVLSRAVAGAQVNDLRLWAERDFSGVAPDLVIVMVGYNDKTWGYPADYYGAVLSDYLDRIAARTDGKAAVLLMPPIPGRGPRFIMMDDYAEAVRALAARRGVALCDMNKVFKAFGRDGLNAYMADTAHPNAKGHAAMAQAIADLLAPAQK